MAGRVVAVLGDTNELTARRSTAARSASHIHALQRLECQTMAESGKADTEGVTPVLRMLEGKRGPYPFARKVEWLVLEEPNV